MLDAKTYSLLAKAAYTPTVENDDGTKNALENLYSSNSLENPGWEVLEVNGKYYTSYVSGFDGVAYGLDTNDDGIYEEVVVAYAGSQEWFQDWTINDGEILIGQVPSQKTDALAFYAMVAGTYCTNEQTNISITGHSLGGALAQLVECDMGAYTVTFNAPGMAEQVGNTGKKNVINYVNMNDIVGSYRAHIGETRYYLPDGKYNNEYQPHSDYVNQDFDKYITLPEGYSWNASKALALYLYDENNDSNLAGDVVQYLKTKFGLTSNTLKEAVETVEAVFGESNRLEEVRKYKDGDTSYILGSGSDEKLIAGTSVYNVIYGNGGNDSIQGGVNNDILWGNQGNDGFRGLGGDDKIYGGAGDDVITGDAGNDYLNGGSNYDFYYFHTGDGHDILEEVDEWSLSAVGVYYYTKRGALYVDGVRLMGGRYNEATNTYEAFQSGISYEWSGINYTDLTINYGAFDSIVIKNFNNGNLGIVFDKSVTTNRANIPNQLTRNKQVPIDLFRDKGVVIDDIGLQFYDVNTQKTYDVVNCEATERLLKSYGENFSNAELDEAGNYMLIEEGEKIKLTHKPVDTSVLVQDMQDTISGTMKEQTDLAIQDDIYIPTSSAEGSPTLQDVYYQYTTKPSGGGILSGIFTLLQIGVCLVTQQWGAAVMIALETGIAGDKVGKIASIANLAFNALKAVTNVQGLAGIMTTVTGKEAIINSGSSFVTGFAADVQKSAALSATLTYNNVSAPSWALNSLTSGSAASSMLAGSQLLNFLVNTNTENRGDTASVYTVNAFTGNISGNYEIPTSNVMDADVSTPEATPKAEISIDRGCPLVLDLTGDGIRTLNIDDTNIYFNIQNSDFSNKTGWISKYDAFLAIDKDNDGKITRQEELFGTETQSGFEVLANYDSNNDGFINSSDSQFSSLKIWQDLNENGITDDGELKSLTEAGIASINLNAVKINDEQNNNTITGMSTFTTTDGTMLHIYNVNLAFNKIYTQYNGSYELSADVLDMVWLRGYGQVADLQLAMTNDEDLKTFVRELSRYDDAKALYNKMDEFLAKWIGCEDIAADAVQNGINSREIEILNKYLGLDLQGEITADKKVFFDSAYQSLKNKIYTEFIAQTRIGDAFEINYDYKTDSILYNDNTYENLIENLPNQKNFFASYIIAKVLNDSNCLDGNKLAYTITEKGYGASLISYLNSGFQFLEDGSLAILNPNTPMYVIGTDGDDVITGTDNADIIYGMDGDDILNGGAGDDYLSGGLGDDTLIGGDGNDTLDGGEGDDSMQGGYGNDTYIYEGDGKDTVLDERWIKIARQEWYQSGFWIFKKWKSRWVYQDKLVDAGQDTIIFGDGVKAKDISITRNGNDLIISLLGTDNKLTVKNWYATSEQRVENFVFADGFVINSGQIMNMKRDTSAADTLSGSNNPDFIISSAGNDTITAGKGDDAIINFEGDTTYIFNSGDGNDVIVDYAGTDKIKLNTGINTEDVKFVRNNKDLIVSIKDMTDSITIINWFENDDNKIETIEFSDGTAYTASDILSQISVSVATGYDDVIVGTDVGSTLDGLAGNDYIQGGAGNDTIIGGLGKDIMKGGAGDDVYYVDNSGDSVVENENEGSDTIYSSISYQLPDNVENLTLIGSGNINAVGNSLNNTITGNDFDNIINTVSGTNTAMGGKGNDTYIISDANKNDLIVENINEGIDTIKSSVTYTLGDNLENLVLDGEDEINGTGNSLDNYLEGNSANNTLNGGAGNDILYGNGGSDILAGGTGNDTYLVDSENATINEKTNEGTDTVVSLIDYTLGDNIENLQLSGTENLSGSGNTLNNTIEGNNADNILNGKKGNDTLIGGKGSDTYIFNTGDGQDIIIEDDPSNISLDTIKFGEGITQDNIILTKTGFDLIITFKNNSADKITIKNSNIDKNSRIEKFEFADGTIFDAKELYIKYASGGVDKLYSDVNYLDVTSGASAIDREYDDYGNLIMERTYGESGFVSKETYYYTNGREQIVRNYNALGLLVDETEYYSTKYLKSKKECEYNSQNQLVQETNYEGNTDNEAILDNIVTYSYNSRGLLSQSVVKEKYYGNFRTDKTINYSYDSQDRISKIETFNGTASDAFDEKISYTYNAHGDITSIKTEVRYNKVLGINFDGTKNTTPAIRVDENITYTYNSNNQILSETVTSCYGEKVEGTTISGKDYSYYKYEKSRKTKETIYTYDSEGNLTGKNTTVGYNQESVGSGGVVTTWAYRPQEQITYTYQNGRITKEVVNSSYGEELTKKVGTRTYHYTVYNMRKTSEKSYEYNSAGNLTHTKEVIGYNKAVLNTSGIDYVWDYRTKAEHNYTYNANGLIECDAVIEDYGKQVSEKVGTRNYTYYKWFTGKTKEIKYVYDDYCRITQENVYKSTSESIWTPYLYEQTKYTYDADGRITKTELSRNGKLVEVYKYDYTFDVNGYLYKQTISKGVISNNSVTSYKQIDEIFMNSYYNKLEGSKGNNTLTGGSQNDELYGNDGNDILYGNTGDDILDGGSGSDVMVGGKGDDTYFIDSSYDKIVELKDDGIDTVNVTYSYTLSDNFENLNLLTESNLNGTGNSVDNIINGNSGDNVLKGLAGDDIIYGSGGNDSLYGGIGDDTYIFSSGDGNDTVTDDAGIDDVIRFDNSVESSNIAIFKDGNDLIIDYGTALGEDSITVKNQELENNTVERIQLSDGKYLSNEDINKIIQNMTSYAANNGIEFTNIESVKNNEDLMNLVASSWHM